MFVDDFDAPTLDTSVWFPHYLPVWSSRAETAATYELGGSCLTLMIPTTQGLWCGDLHPTPIRVSAIMSGNFSGPVGSTIGQQHFTPGLTVREEQARFEGWLPAGGHVEIRCAMDLSPRSMAAMWMSGFEDDPVRCGELCVTEIFGKDVEVGRSAEVGMGIKAFRDPDLVQDFAAPRLAIDVAAQHVYAVDWDASAAVFSVDGERSAAAHGRPPTRSR